MNAIATTLLLLAAASPSAVPVENAPAALVIREKGNGRIVPALPFSTSFALRFVTDNDGVIALDDPDVIGHKTWFGILGFGYGLDKDFIGNAGFAFKPNAGEEEKREVKRTGKVVALGRLTGSGVFVESKKLGRRGDYMDDEALCRSGVQAAVLGKRVFYVWNRTKTMDGERESCVTGGAAPKDLYCVEEPPVVPRYSPLSGAGSTETLFEKEDWKVALSGLVLLPDSNGKSRLVAVYTRYGDKDEMLERGLCELSGSKRRFVIRKALWKKEAHGDTKPEDFPIGHAVPYRDLKSGTDWILFCDPFPTVRVKASYADWYSGGRNWVKVPKSSLADEAKSGSIAFAPSVKKWIAVYQGKNPGEVWQARADSPFGPWSGEEKILSVGNYTFESPLIHHFSLKNDSRYLLFEGAISARGGKDKRGFIPRILDNEMLFRLDL